jgi:hypothetical protein
VEEAAEVQDAEVFQSAASVDDSPQAFQSMNQDLQLLRKQFETQKLNTPKTISEAEIRGLVEATIKIQVDSQVKEAVQVMVIPQVKMMKELQGAFKQSAEAQIALKKAFVQILEKAKVKLAEAGVSKVDLDAAKAQVEKLGGSDEAKAGFMKILETQMGVAAKATALQAVAEVEDMQVEMVKQQEQVALANSEAMDKVKVILAQTLQNQSEPIQRKLLELECPEVPAEEAGKKDSVQVQVGTSETASSESASVEGSPPPSAGRTEGQIPMVPVLGAGGSSAAGAAALPSTDATIGKESAPAKEVTGLRQPKTKAPEEDDSAPASPSKKQRLARTSSPITDAVGKMGVSPAAPVGTSSPGAGTSQSALPVPKGKAKKQKGKKGKR